ncbi:MAG: sigma 54-interacting transcriptional regulator, partial [Candidatus Binatia bacterium]
EMSINLQAKLLRVLEDERFVRVGGTRPIQVDVRVVAASNRNLERAIEEGVFRADLFYRLNVVSVHLPPLRERADDIPFLLNYFLESKAQAHSLPVKRFSRTALAAIMAYSWPGNVRELENAIEHAVVLTGDRLELEVTDLPDRLRYPTGEGPIARLVPEVLSGRRSIGEAVDIFERTIIERGLEIAGTNQTRAAELLGTTRRILKYKIDKLGARGGGPADGADEAEEA